MFKVSGGIKPGMRFIKLFLKSTFYFCQSLPDVPKEERTEKYKPERTEKSKPDRAEKLKPERTEKSKPERTEKSKPERTEKSKTERTEKSKPEKSKAASRTSSITSKVYNADCDLTMPPGKFYFAHLLLLIRGHS